MVDGRPNSKDIGAIELHGPFRNDVLTPACRSGPPAVVRSMVPASMEEASDSYRLRHLGRESLPRLIGTVRESL